MGSGRRARRSRTRTCCSRRRRSRSAPATSSPACSARMRTCTSRGRRLGDFRQDRRHSQAGRGCVAGAVRRRARLPAGRAEGGRGDLPSRSGARDAAGAGADGGSAAQHPDGAAGRGADRGAGRPGASLHASRHRVAATPGRRAPAGAGPGPDLDRARRGVGSDGETRARAGLHRERGLHADAQGPRRLDRERQRELAERALGEGSHDRRHRRGVRGDRRRARPLRRADLGAAA